MIIIKYNYELIRNGSWCEHDLLVISIAFRFCFSNDALQLVFDNLTYTGNSFDVWNGLQIQEMIQCQIIHLKLPLTSVVVSHVLD